jgi:hypothetical protein
MSDSWRDYPELRPVKCEATRAQAIRHAIPLLESLAKRLEAGDPWDKADADDLRSVTDDLRSAL